MEKQLRILQDEIAARVRAIVADRPDWPCRRGCDYCCRHLATLPRLTEPEWKLLREGLARLPAESRSAIKSRIEQLRGGAGRPIVCPMLDPNSGACLVYEYRPIACRTYGSYVERDGGLYCPEIEALAETGATDGIVWGNGAAVEAKVRRLGKEMNLLEWFAGSRGASALL